MSEPARRVAELLDKGKKYEEVARELGYKLKTVRHYYAQMYRNYVEAAKERLLDLYFRGYKPEVAKEVVKEELNITDAMLLHASAKAGMEILKMWQRMMGLRRE
jgi:transposase-like protein